MASWFLYDIYQNVILSTIVKEYSAFQFFSVPNKTMFFNVQKNP